MDVIFHTSVLCLATIVAVYTFIYKQRIAFAYILNYILKSSFLKARFINDLFNTNKITYKPKEFYKRIYTQTTFCINNNNNNRSNLQIVDLQPPFNSQYRASVLFCIYHLFLFHTRVKIISLRIIGCKFSMNINTYTYIFILLNYNFSSSIMFDKIGLPVKYALIIISIITISIRAPMIDGKLLTNCQVASELKRMNVQRSYISNCKS